MRLPYRYIDGEFSSLYKRNEIGVLAVYFSLCVYGDLRALNGHPHKKELIHAFLWEAGFRWKKGQHKEAVKRLTVPHADLFNV